MNSKSSWKSSYSPRNRCKSLGDDIEGLYRSRIENFIIYQRAATIDEIAQTAERWGVPFSYHSDAKKTARSMVRALTVEELIRLIKKHTGCCDFRRFRG